MTEKVYTPEQISNAERLSDIIASVPAENQQEVIRMVEAMILGVEIADKLNSGTKGISQVN